MLSLQHQCNHCLKKVSVIRIQIRLTEAQIVALKAMAAARRSSVAELIRQGVDHLIRQAGSVDLAERRRRAVAAAGRFRSGRPDVAARHDEYLAEVYQG